MFEQHALELFFEEAYDKNKTWSLKMILTRDTKTKKCGNIKPKQCPNCSEPNKPDSKFCAKCKMVLTYGAYSETLEKENEEESEIESLKQQMSSLQESQKEILECLKYPEKLAQIAKEG